MFATQEKPIQITAPLTEAQQTILSEEAARFLSRLAQAFEPRRRQLLADRRERQQAVDNGAMPEFLSSTADIRNREWRVAPIPADLLNRRVEITGPVERKMIINALNSGASVFMADFEDSNSPTWSNVMQGQVNLRDAVRGEITYTSPEGKRYEVSEKPAVLMVRPRGWHLTEKHVLVEWRTHLGVPLRFRPLLLPQRQNVDRRRFGPILLPAENGKPPGGTPVE